MNIYPNSDLNTLTDRAHPVFKDVEKEFDEWFENLPYWVKQAYEGYGEDEPAACNKAGAIEDAIEGMIDEANSTGKPVNISKYDTAQHFQPC